MDNNMPTLWVVQTSRSALAVGIALTATNCSLSSSGTSFLPESLSCQWAVWQHGLSVKALTQRCDLSLCMHGTCVLGQYCAQSAFHSSLIVSAPFVTACDPPSSLPSSGKLPLVQCLSLVYSFPPFSLTFGKSSPQCPAGWSARAGRFKQRSCSEVITVSHTSRPFGFSDLTAGFCGTWKAGPRCAPTIISPYLLRKKCKWIKNAELFKNDL